MPIPNTADTIAAIATPPGEGAIGIVRVSGAHALAIARRVFVRQRPGAWRSHRLYYGTIVDPASREVIDRALCAYMRGPHSYTGEDVVEFSCHGSPVVLRRTLDLLLQQGARLAYPGEFTLRAFLNGRLDLAQAEAVMDVVRSRTHAGLSLALGQLEGRLSQEVRRIRDGVLDLLARLEANIDFSEDDVPSVPAEEVLSGVAALVQQLERMLETARQGVLVREGIRAVLVGRPNVGKSSLLNAFVQADRAIVTDIPGTTRDVIEETVEVEGVPLVLADTAGIAESADVVEQIGIQRSRKALEAADLVLLVVDGSQPLTQADRAVMLEVQHALAQNPDQRLIIVLNKVDLPLVVSPSEVASRFRGAPVVRTSAVQPDGLHALRKEIISTVLGGGLRADAPVVTSLRHRRALEEAREGLLDARQAATDGLPADFICIGLRTALLALGEVTGENATEDLLDRIFSRFCIGK